MDPIAHTLAGASLSLTGLKKITPLATVTLVLAANLPDIDGIANFMGRDHALYYRRGITHGIIALIILPVLLAVAISVYDKLVRLKRDPAKKPTSFKGLVIVSYIGVISHPFLDWLNTYGVRLLMPFSDKWFYGDTLFIVDAWMWLLMGAAVFLAYSSNRFSQTLWAILAAATSLLVTTLPFVPLFAKLTWYLGLAIILTLKLKNLKKIELIARLCIIGFLVYLSLTSFSKQRAEDLTYEWVSQKTKSPIKDIMTGPVAANPFVKEVLLVTESHYYGLRVNFLNQPHVTMRYEPVPIEKPNPIVEKALSSDNIKGFRHWMRYPTFEVKESVNEYIVIIRDLRYVMPQQTQSPGIGMVEVKVSKL